MCSIFSQLSEQFSFNADFEFKSEAQNWKAAIFKFWTLISWYKQSPHQQETTDKRNEIKPNAQYLKRKTKLKPHPLNYHFCDLILTKLMTISQLQDTLFFKSLLICCRKKNLRKSSRKKQLNIVISKYYFLKAFIN